MISTLTPEQLAGVVARFREGHPLIAPLLEQQLRRDLGYGSGELGEIATLALHRRMAEAIEEYERQWRTRR